MRKSQKNINSLADLLKHLKKDTKGYKGNIWFRGQNVSTWKLQPSFLRKDKTISEFTLITKFKQNASLLIDRTPSSYFDWLFQMQHHGVPTRLLDWTESALTALYFAVENDIYKNQDGALWILLPTELNKYSKIDSDEDDFIPSFENLEVLGAYEPLAFNREKVTKLLPLAAIATRNNPRMQAQLGVFTISHRDKTPIEDIGTKKHIWKYLIPKANKKIIKEELKLLGINKFQLFPELSSKGEILNKEF
jgi:hypothetical protein